MFLKTRPTLFSSFCFVATRHLLCANASIDFDIHGKPERFQIEDSIDVDDDCFYTGTIVFNAPGANLPFPKDPALECNPDTGFDYANCEEQSCLFGMRNAYELSKKFQDATGFNHVGMDWSPCGHPPVDKFAKPHLDMHLFQITTEEREEIDCDMDNPFICALPPSTQTTASGKKFYIVGTVQEDENSEIQIANAPTGFSSALDTAVPGDGLHAWDQDAAPDLANWLEPLLVIGTYDGGFQFWEPMLPYEFISGEDVHEYDSSVTYVAQTIESLPTYWSMRYDPQENGGTTTLIIRGKASKCSKGNSGKKGRKRMKGKSLF